MANKRLQIENLDNLQDLTIEEVSSLQGSLRLIDEYKGDFVVDDGNGPVIEPPPGGPGEPMLPDYPLPPVKKGRRPRPCSIKPYYPIKPPICSPEPYKEIPWCPVIL